MQTLAHHFEEGGWGMYPILMCQVAVAALLLGRAFALARSIGPREKLTRVIASHLSQGDLQGALMVCAASHGAAAAIAKRILLDALGAPERMMAARDEALAIEEPRLAKSVGWFKAWASLATLFGLLGTITGLTLGFGCVANVDASSKATMLAKAISESMNCTAFGLLITVFAVMSFGFVRAWLDRDLARLRAESLSVVNLAVHHHARLRLGEARAAYEPGGYRVGRWDR